MSVFVWCSLFTFRLLLPVPSVCIDEDIAACRSPWIIGKSVCLLFLFLCSFSTCIGEGIAAHRSLLLLSRYICSCSFTFSWLRRVESTRTLESSSLKAKISPLLAARKIVPTSIILGSSTNAGGLKLRDHPKQEVYLRKLGDSTRLVN